MHTIVVKHQQTPIAICVNQLQPLLALSSRLNLVCNEIEATTGVIRVIRWNDYLAVAGQQRFFEK